MNVQPDGLPERQAARLYSDIWFPARLAAGLPAAAAVTLGLLWGMQYLVLAGAATSSGTHAGATLDFVRLQRQTPPERQARQRPQRPPPAQTPPPEPPLPQLQPATPGPGTIAVSAPPRVEPRIHLRHGGFSLDTGDGEYLPILKVAPHYPPRASARGIEGYCIVQYTVNARGSVQDARVLEDQCTHRLFREPSLQAALKFKYKPRVIDGQAVAVTGVRNRFVYRLEETP